VIYGRTVEFFSPTVIAPLFYFSVFGLGSVKLVLENDVRALKLLMFALAGILFYYFGVMSVSPFSRGLPRKDLPVERRYWNPHVLGLLFFISVAMSVLMTAYHFWKTGIPLLTPDIEAKRVLIHQTVSGYVVFSMRLITPALLFFLSAKLLQEKYSKQSVIFFFGLGLTILAGLANRHDMFTLTMCCLVIFNFSRQRISLTRLLPLLLIGLVLLMSMGYYRLSSLSFTTPEKAYLIQATGGDPLLMFPAYGALQFTNYPSNLAIYMETFPHKIPYEYGYSLIRALSTMLPGHQELLDEYVKSALHLEFLGGGINPTILGELYANFGYMGVLGMSVYGGVVSYLYNRMLRNRSGINVILYSFAITSLLLAIIGGFFSFSLPIFYIIIIACIHFISKYYVRSG
jgi:oligosaccharide repeat unit polymerase